MSGEIDVAEAVKVAGGLLPLLGTLRGLFIKKAKKAKAEAPPPTVTVIFNFYGSRTTRRGGVPTSRG